MQGAWEVMYDLSRWTVARRVYSTRQVKELMVDFWSNLLHVPLMHDDSMFWRKDYDTTIRTYALDTFENLLLHTTTHPAMGLFLNNAISTKDAPNENLGRELLELHTVGLEYDEDDVKSSSRILTGYRVDVWWPSFRSFYDPKVHWTGRINVLGFSHANTSTDGRAATTAYLKYLARHPATAQRLAERLCVRFVNDHPSTGLVDTVRKAYLTQRHRDQADAAGAGGPPGVPGLGRPEGAHADRGLRRDRAGAGHPDGEADHRRLVRQRHVLAVPRARPGAVRVAGARTASRRSTPPGPAPGGS